MDKVKPEYYNNSKISPFDVWDDWRLDPYTATALKYIKRAGNKPGNDAAEDLKKAITYLKEKVERVENETRIY